MVCIVGKIEGGKAVVLNLDRVDRYTVTVKTGKVDDNTITCKLCVVYDNVKIESEWKTVEIEKGVSVDEFINSIVFHALNYIGLYSEKMIVFMDFLFDVTVETVKRMIESRNRKGR